MPSVVISASLAYDRIMTFRGSFKDHILPEKAHVLSVSFLLDSLRLLRGGIAGNIAYNLALLGEPVAVVGAAGYDFGDYRAAFTELGIDTSLVRQVAEEPTASAFLMSDLDDNQIAAFYPGASVHAAEISVRDIGQHARYGVVGATTPDAMRKHVAEFAAIGLPYVYDPSQQLVVLPPDDLLAGIETAAVVVGNDYELAMLGRKTGLGVDDIAARVPLVVVTYGEQGSELLRGGQTVRVPAAKVEKVVGPTGAGDAYRAGLLKGLLLGLDLDVTGRLAAVAAAYAVEQHGTQEHTFTPEEFVARFDATFPDYAGAIAGQDLSSAASNGTAATSAAAAPATRA